MTSVKTIWDGNIYNYTLYLFQWMFCLSHTLLNMRVEVVTSVLRRCRAHHNKEGMMVWLFFFWTHKLSTACTLADRIRVSEQCQTELIWESQKGVMWGSRSASLSDSQTLNLIGKQPFSRNINSIVESVVLSSSLVKYTVIFLFFPLPQLWEHILWHSPWPPASHNGPYHLK